MANALVAVFACLAIAICASAAQHKLRIVRDPPQPNQPADFLVYISNFCNTTMTLTNEDYNVWEGHYITPPPTTVASQLTGAFKYGWEIKAQSSSERINATLVYENPFLFVDAFAVPYEWGLELSWDGDLNVFTTQADVGLYSIYNVHVGYNVTC